MPLMFRNSQSTLEDAERALGKNCVLLVGSVISARWRNGEPFVPGVGAARTAVVELLAERLETLAGQAYLHKLAGAYARQLLDRNNIFSDVLNELKFEEFIWRIQKSVSPEKLNGLMRALFFCEAGEFDANHAAVVSLMCNKKISFTITTNFDNGIERANQWLNGTNSGHISKHVMPSPKNMAELSRIPRSLIKLHGDVETDRYVSTSPALYDRLVAERAQQLRTILDDKSVIVLGYGGRGDIDIFPELLACHNTDFYWLEYDARRECPLKIEGHMRARTLRGDLTALDETNPLLKLAQLGSSMAVGGTPSWRARLRAWVASLEIHELHDMVGLLLSNGSGMPDLHMRWVCRRKYGFNDPRSHPMFTTIKRNRGQISSEPTALFFAYLNVNDYRSAEKELNDLSFNMDGNIGIYLWKGFISWRLGLRGQALDQFHIFHNISEKPQLDQNAPIAWIGLRMYIEVAVDEARRYGPTGGALVKHSPFVKIAAMSLNRLIKENAIEDLQDEFISKIAICLYDLFFLNIHIKEQLQEIFSTCRDLNMWSAAETAARGMAQVDPREARMMFRSLTRIQKTRTNSENTMRKQFASLVYGVTNSGFLFDILDNHAMLARLKLIQIRANIAKRERYWVKFSNSQDVVCEVIRTKNDNFTLDALNYLNRSLENLISLKNMKRSHCTITTLELFYYFSIQIPFRWLRQKGRRNFKKPLEIKKIN